MMSDAITTALNSEAVGMGLQSMFVEPAATTREEFAQYTDEKMQSWTPLIKRTNLTGELSKITNKE